MQLVEISSARLGRWAFGAGRGADETRRHGTRHGEDKDEDKREQAGGRGG